MVYPKADRCIVYGTTFEPQLPLLLEGSLPDLETITMSPSQAVDECDVVEGLRGARIGYSDIRTSIPGLGAE